MIKNNLEKIKNIPLLDAVLLASFFISGCSALIYQVSWQRALYGLIGSRDGCAQNAPSAAFCGRLKFSIFFYHRTASPCPAIAVVVLKGVRISLP